MRFQTDKCSAFGQFAVSFEAASDLGLAKSLLGFIEQRVAAGERFKDEETFQVGWMVLKLKLLGGTLELWEPDFGGLPLQRRPGLDPTGRHLLLHRAVCDEMKVEPEFPSILDTAVVSPSFTERGDGFQMSRDPRGGRDSGWVFAEPGYSATEARLASLYEIAISRPEVIPFLALPPGSSVVNDRGSILALSDNHRATEKSSSLLDALLCYGHGPADK